MNTLAEAVEVLRTAMIKADVAVLTACTAPALSYGHANGTIESQSEFIAVIEEKKNNYQAIELSEVSMCEYGSIGVVRHRFKGTVYIDGVLAHSDVRALQVWIKDDKSWKLIARQAYRLP